MTQIPKDPWNKNLVDCLDLPHRGGWNFPGLDS